MSSTEESTTPSYISDGSGPVICSPGKELMSSTGREQSGAENEDVSKTVVMADENQPRETSVEVLQEENRQYRTQIKELQQDKQQLSTDLKVFQWQGPVDKRNEYAMDIGFCVLETSPDCSRKQLLLLPCLHSVCQACADQNRHETIICRCGRDISLGKVSLPIDYVNRNEASLNFDDMNCGYFQDECPKKLFSYCMKCNIPLCRDCQKVHNQTKISVKHKVVSIEDISQIPPWHDSRNYTCQEHPGHQLIYVDQTCKTPVCKVCVRGPHRGHAVEAVESVYNRVKENLLKSLAKHSARLRELQQHLRKRRNCLVDLRHKRDMVEIDIEHTHEQITVNCDNRLKYLLQRTKEEEKELKDKVLKDVNSLCESEAAFDITVTYANRSLEFTSQVEFIELMEALMRKMQEDLEHSIPEDDSETSHIVFSPRGQKALDELVGMFGDVRCSTDTEPEEDDIPTITDSFSRLKNAEADSRQLRSSVEKLETEKAKAEQEVKSLQEDVSNSKLQTETLEKTVLDLRHQTKEAKNTIKESQTKLKTKEIEIRQLKEKGAEVASILEIPLRQQGIYLLRPGTVDKAYLLHCTQLKFDCDKVNIDKVHINTDGDLVNKPDTKPHADSKDRLVKYKGTASTAPLSRCGSPQYWEVTGRVDIDKALAGKELLLETGLSLEEERDQHHCLSGRPQSCSLNVSHCTEHSSICRKVWRQGDHVLCLSDTLPNNPRQSVTLHYGVVFDDARCRVAFVDVSENTVISTLKDVDCSRPLWPMFGVYYSDKGSVSVSLVVGTDIDMSRKKKELILDSLS